MTSQMPVFCTLSQTCTQRMHLMHFWLSRISGKSEGFFGFGRCCGYGLSRMFRSLEISCRRQFPLRTQVVQDVLCSERISCTLVLRPLSAFAELVWITMPSSTLLLQAVKRRSYPSTSTTHTRQAPISFRPFQ